MSAYGIMGYRNNTVVLAGIDKENQETDYRRLFGQTNRIENVVSMVKA